MIRKLLYVVAIVLIAMGTFSILSAGAEPPGNNGTVKVDGAEFDSHPDNEPHVGCTFQIDWYGFDANVVSSVEFDAQPPTGTRVLLTDTVILDGDDNAGGGSEAGLDGSATYTLSFTSADFLQPNQGYHVMLTIDTTGSIGADVKHKVFWVTGCAAPSVTPSLTPSPTPTPTPSPTPTPTPSPSPTPSPTPPSHHHVSPPPTVAFTGSGNAIPLSLAAFGLLILGALLFTDGRRIGRASRG